MAFLWMKLRVLCLSCFAILCSASFWRSLRSVEGVDILEQDNGQGAGSVRDDSEGEDSSCAKDSSGQGRMPVAVTRMGLLRMRQDTFSKKAGTPPGRSKRVISG
ncbi:hypothetical protein EA58_18580 [Photobacterium galatheae]|uniref:Uncharacterized protein n=1 Tax=Photobacterium galatheae TaxID=1654360 RepID=A0A066RIQ9_9GAMM|nr:hypothetical protein EA58_18580 [Photobacterium galatheae]